MLIIFGTQRSWVRIPSPRRTKSRRYRKVSPVFLFVNTTESNWQGICAAEGVVAARPVDARSATTGAERRTNPVASIAGNPVK